MLKDVIQEYDEYFPEIIERASYALEKVKGHPLWDGEVLNGTKVYTSLWGDHRDSLIQPYHCANEQMMA